MTREAALMRFLYIRTLRRHVGPLMGWRVVTPSNDLHRTLSFRGVCKAAGNPSLPAATFSAGDA
jgi:hypothetical protein